MPRPTRRARRWVPPKPGVMPRPTSGWPKTALSEQMRMSQLMASSLPPPSAKPLTAAMTGMGKLSIIRKMSLPSLPKASPSALVMVLIEPMSAPATKLLSPSPVRTMQRMVFWSTASKAAFRSARTSGFSAFSALGRSMVMISTAPCTSVFTNAIAFPFTSWAHTGAGSPAPARTHIKSWYQAVSCFSPSPRWWRSPCRRRCTGWPGPSWRRGASWRTAG